VCPRADPVVYVSAGAGSALDEARWRAYQGDGFLGDHQSRVSYERGFGPLLVIPGSHRHDVSCAGRTPPRHYERALQCQEYGLPNAGARA
jgi:hypothetical protein